jgi:hypothetical protein
MDAPVFRGAGSYCSICKNWKGFKKCEAKCRIGGRVTITS